MNKTGINQCTLRHITCVFWLLWICMSCVNGTDIDFLLKHYWLSVGIFVYTLCGWKNKVMESIFLFFQLAYLSLSMARPRLKVSKAVER